MSFPAWVRATSILCKEDILGQERCCITASAEGNPSNSPGSWFWETTIWTRLKHVKACSQLGSFSVAGLGCSTATMTLVGGRVTESL